MARPRCATWPRSWPSTWRRPSPRSPPPMGAPPWSSSAAGSTTCPRTLLAGTAARGPPRPPARSTLAPQSAGDGGHVPGGGPASGDGQAQPEDEAGGRVVGRHARQYHPSRRRSGRGWRERRELRAGGGRARAGGLRRHPPVGWSGFGLSPRQSRRVVLPAPADRRHRRGRLRPPRRRGPPARPRPRRVPRRPRPAARRGQRPAPLPRGQRPHPAVVPVPARPRRRVPARLGGRRPRANIDAARAAADGDLAPMRALLAPAVRIVDRSSYR